MATTDNAAPLDLSLYPQGAVIDDRGRLVLGGCAVSELAAEFGTPAMVVDESALPSRAREYLAAFNERHADSRVLFASKSFPSASVIGLLAEEGCGIDVASGEELLIAQSSGVEPAEMVLHGNAKSDFDIQCALTAGVGYVVVDNLDDVERIARFATRPTPVLLRVSPQVDASTHEKMMTGHDASKFGVPSTQVADAIDRISREPMIDLHGLHAHIGSGITDLGQFDAAVRALSRVGRFRAYNFGGGLGVRYTAAEQVPSLAEYADVLVSAVHEQLGTDVRIMVEPGRSMVARSTVTVYRVVTVKRGVRTHVAVDGGMGDNLEVALYGQAFSPSIIDRVGAPEVCDVVGRHCESGDTLSRDTVLPNPRVGDLVTVPVTGAYCFTMSNNYNGALRPPVLFVKDGGARVAVRRETMNDLLRRDLLIAGPR